MKRKIVFTTIAGTLLFFCWHMIAHAVLQLGEKSFRELPPGNQIVAAMKASLSEPGIYFFPGSGLPPNASAEEKKKIMPEWTERFQKGPYGLLIYHPQGTTPLSIRQIATEFFLELIQSLLVVVILANVSTVRTARLLGVATAVSLLATITTNVPYWNWYGFPLSYTGASIFIDFVGLMLVASTAAYVFYKFGRGRVI